MINIPNDIKEKIKEYENKFNKKPPRGWNFREETLNEYKQYLEKELSKSD